MAPEAFQKVELWSLTLVILLKPVGESPPSISLAFTPEQSVFWVILKIWGFFYMFLCAQANVLKVSYRL